MASLMDRMFDGVDAASAGWPDWPTALSPVRAPGSRSQPTPSPSPSKPCRRAPVTANRRSAMSTLVTGRRRCHADARIGSVLFARTRRWAGTRSALAAGQAGDCHGPAVPRRASISSIAARPANWICGAAMSRSTPLRWPRWSRVPGAPRAGPSSSPRGRDPARRADQGPVPRSVRCGLGGLGSVCVGRVPVPRWAHRATPDRDPHPA